MAHSRLRWCAGNSQSVSIRMRIIGQSAPVTPEIITKLQQVFSKPPDSIAMRNIGTAFRGASVYPILGQRPTIACRYSPTIVGHVTTIERICWGMFDEDPYAVDAQASRMVATNINAAH